VNYSPANEQYASFEHGWPRRASNPFTEVRRGPLSARARTASESLRKIPTTKGPNFLAMIGPRDRQLLRTRLSSMCYGGRQRTALAK
jgi:hypothetical protein